MIALLAVPLLMAAAIFPPSAAQSADPAKTGPDVIMLDQVPGCYGAVRFDHRLHVGMSAIGSSCGSCHHTEAIQPCRSCHDATTTAVATDRPGLRGAYHQQCLGCHRDWTHENACGFCHTDANSIAGAPGRPRTAFKLQEPRASAQQTYVYHTTHPSMPVVTFHHADHTAVFGLNCADCHGGNSCGQCHGPATARPVVKRQEACFTCHAGDRCTTCHHLTEKPRFNHADCANWRLRPGHDTLACADCHDPARKFARPSSDTCRACHARQSGGEFNHDSTGVVLFGDHARFSCLDCHTGGDDTTIARCTSCHETRPVAGQREVGRRPLFPSPAP